LCHATESAETCDFLIALGTHPPMTDAAIDAWLGLNDEARACPKIRQLSTAELLAETMRRISDEESVSSLYVD